MSQTHFCRPKHTDAWFEVRGAGEFEILEQSYAVPNDEVVTILHIVDDEMLDG